MPYLEVSGDRLWYDESGAGPPVVYLHGGWGRKVFPFDDAAEVLSRSRRVIEPDRRGYGRSPRIDLLPREFHEDEARRLPDLLDALGLERAVLWGHSDGAVIAALFAAAHPDRVTALVLEAAHLHRRKSRKFFEDLARDPRTLPPHVRAKLAEDHGEPCWETLIRAQSRAWIELNDQGGDFYGEQLAAIRSPTLLVYGENDLHTPPEEQRELARRLPDAELVILPGGGHSPHSESRTARICSQRVERFLGDNAP